MVVGGIALLAITSPKLTALVLLSVEEEGVSPMIFVRTDCAVLDLIAADPELHGHDDPNAEAA